MRLQHVPNILTCCRFLLIGPVLYAILHQHYGSAFYLFVIAGLTDALDGLLARVYGWTSRFGSIADPLADKLLLMGCFVALVWMDIIPLWLVVILIARDIWIMSGVLAYRTIIGPIDFVPAGISKVNTFLQILLVGAFLVDLGVFHVPQLLLQSIMYAVLVTTVVSFCHYTWEWSRRARLNYRAKNLNRTIQRNMNV